MSDAYKLAGTMALSYFIGTFTLNRLKSRLTSLGGLIPMLPYFQMENITHALFVSIAITIVVLLIFGFVKNYLTIGTAKAGFYGSVQTLVVGVIAAATS